MPWGILNMELQNSILKGLICNRSIIGHQHLIHHEIIFWKGDLTMNSPTLPCIARLFKRLYEKLLLMPDIE